MAIKSASITGTAVEVSASGSIDSTGEIIRFDGKLDVAKLDLNGLSFLKTYSAGPSDPRRATRATVSVVGPGGKIATVASADMHKLNVGAAFFFSTVSAHRKRAARWHCQTNAS